MGLSTDKTYYDDGGFPWDGFTAAIGNKTFIFEDLTPVEGSHFVQSNNQSGAPRGGRDIRDVITAKGTMQYPSGATDADAPALFTEITVPFRGQPKVFILTEISFGAKSGQERKDNVSLREKLNAAAGGVQ